MALRSLNSAIVGSSSNFEPNRNPQHTQIREVVKKQSSYGQAGRKGRPHSLPPKFGPQKVNVRRENWLFKAKNGL